MQNPVRLKPNTGITPNQMIKYLPALTSVVLEEIPGKVTLAVSISNCKGNCPGCHTPELRQDIGDELTREVLEKLIKDNFGINCVLFLGEGRDDSGILDLAKYIKGFNLQVALYSGMKEVGEQFYSVFDYVKVGPYIEKLGPLNKPTTNQKLYQVIHRDGKNERVDVTYLFHKHTF